MGSQARSDATVTIVTKKAGEVFEETLPATSLGKNRYRLDAIPVYAVNVSLHDIVLAPLSKGVPTFKKVVEKSGARTIRAVFPEGFDEGSKGEDLVRSLNRFGCRTAVNGSIVSICIPPSIRVLAIGEFLDDSYIEWHSVDPYVPSDLPGKGIRRLIAGRFKWMP